MADIDPSIEYARVMHTDGHRWKLYEIHRSHIKKTKFFIPRPKTRKTQEGRQQGMHTEHARFFDDYEHMLSVIGLIRFAMGIGENIVEASENYDVEELKDDPRRTI